MPPFGSGAQRGVEVAGEAALRSWWPHHRESSRQWTHARFVTAFSCLFGRIRQKVTDRQTDRRVKEDEEVLLPGGIFPAVCASACVRGGWTEEAASAEMFS